MDNKELIFSLDIGTRSIIGDVGNIRNKKFNVLCEKYKEHEERAMIDGQIHDINLVSKTVKEVKEYIEKELDTKLENVAIAAAGRYLKTSEARFSLKINENEEITKDIIRSLELSAVKKTEEEIKTSTDGKLFCVGYSVKNYYLNSYVISNLLGHKGETIEVEVIATFLPRSVVDSLYSVMKNVNLQVTSLTLEPIAAIEAAVPTKLRLLNIALVDIGAGTSDIAISQKERISAYGMVPIAGDEITEAIAQEYLVDFNEAERIKRTVLKDKEVTFTDVLGIENVVGIDSINKLIKPVVIKMANSIGSKIIEINGNKPPAAVFLVGGGAHSPFLIEELAKVLNIDEKRIAIKDRKSVEDCVCNNDLGSAGVTVLGIALTSINRLGDHFIDVNFNNEVISIFSQGNNTVSDIFMQSQTNPALLIGKSGKNLKFTVNDKKRFVFGDLGKNATIKVNNKIADLESPIKNGDIIKVTYAKNGKDAKALVSDYIGNINSISIYIDDELINIEPFLLINDKEVAINTAIKEGDNVKIFIPQTIQDLKTYILKNENITLFKNGEELENQYIIEEGLKIHTKTEIKPEIKQEIENTITVNINDEMVKLTGKKEYVFVDIFNYFNFDLTIAKGISINLILNGKKASYTDVLRDKDEIKVYWS